MSFLGISLPSFWGGMMLIYLLAVNLHWLPVGGSDSFKSLIMPAITLSLSMSAYYIRRIRAVMVEQMNEEYINGCHFLHSWLSDTSLFTLSTWWSVHSSQRWSAHFRLHKYTVLLYRKQVPLVLTAGTSFSRKAPELKTKDFRTSRIWSRNKKARIRNGI